MNWQIIVGTLFLIGGIGNILNNFLNSLITLLIGFAFLFCGLKRNETIKKSISAAPSARTLTEEDFYAAGVSYYESNIKKLAIRNPEWKLTASQIIKSGKAGKQIFKDNYIHQPVKLIFEPDNPHDENAIMVQIAGEKVGYISREDNLHVKDILNNREVISISGFIGGGEYKIVREDGETYKDGKSFRVNVRIKYI